MNISQDQLKAFYEVSRLTSFTKASQYLGVTQSALSHRIKNLEAELEVTLFVRASSGLRLTEAGTNLLQYCLLQRQLEDELLSTLKSGPLNQFQGTLRIGGASTLMWSVVTPALAPFLRENSHLQLEMLVRELNELPNMLLTGQVDMIVTCGKPNRNQFEEINLGEEVNILVESSKFSKIPNVYLDHHPDDQTTFDFLKFQGKGVENLKRLYMDNIQGILTGAQEGFGKAVIPQHLLRGQKNLKQVKGTPKYKQSVYLCFMKQTFYSKLHERIFDTLRERSALFLMP